MTLLRVATGITGSQIFQSSEKNPGAFINTSLHRGRRRLTRGQHVLCIQGNQ